MDGMPDHISHPTAARRYRYGILYSHAPEGRMNDCRYDAATDTWTPLIRPVDAHRLAGETVAAQPGIEYEVMRTTAPIGTREAVWSDREGRTVRDVTRERWS